MNFTRIMQRACIRQYYEPSSIAQFLDEKHSIDPIPEDNIVARIIGYRCAAPLLFTEVRAHMQGSIFVLSDVTGQLHADALSTHAREQITGDGRFVYDEIYAAYFPKTGLLRIDDLVVGTEPMDSSDDDYIRSPFDVTQNPLLSPAGLLWGIR